MTPSHLSLFFRPCWLFCLFIVILPLYSTLTMTLSTPLLQSTSCFLVICLPHLGKQNFLTIYWKTWERAWIRKPVRISISRREAVLSGEKLASPWSFGVVSGLLLLPSEFPGSLLCGRGEVSYDNEFQPSRAPVSKGCGKTLLLKGKPLPPPARALRHLLKKVESRL